MREKWSSMIDNRFVRSHSSARLSFPAHPEKFNATRSTARLRCGAAGAATLPRFPREYERDYGFFKKGNFTV